jgi:hypothetical protein
MKRWVTVSVAGLAALGWLSLGRLRADYIKIQVGDRETWLEGTVNVLAGGTYAIRLEQADRPLTLKHISRGEVAGVVDVRKAPTRSQLLTRRLAEAQKRTIDDCFQVALWITERGFVDRLPELLKIAEAKAPQDERLRKLKEFYERVRQPIPEAPEQRKYMESIMGPGFEYKTSDHYLLAHDSPGAALAQRRLELLENVYQTFYVWFYLKGRELRFPKEKLMVVLYGAHENFKVLVDRTDPELIHAAGFFHRLNNLAVFWAQDTSEFGQAVRKIQRDLQKQAEEAKKRRDAGAGEIVRLVQVVNLLQDVSFESEEVEVVSHEGLHQLAGNSGLLPRRIFSPHWVNEGLAAFFETPKDATWAGIGAVNERRINSYRLLRDRYREVCKLDFVASDRIFTHAANVAAMDAAYGPSWALTHFMLNKKFDQFMKYYEALSRLPVDMPIPEDQLLSVFQKVFGGDLSGLEQEWHFYMRELKTEQEALEEST